MAENQCIDTHTGRDAFTLLDKLCWDVSKKKSPRTVTLLFRCNLLQAGRDWLRWLGSLYSCVIPRFFCFRFREGKALSTNCFPGSKGGNAPLRILMSFRWLYCSCAVDIIASGWHAQRGSHLIHCCLGLRIEALRILVVVVVVVVVVVLVVVVVVVVVVRFVVVIVSRFDVVYGCFHSLYYPVLPVSFFWVSTRPCLRLTPAKVFTFSENIQVNAASWVWTVATVSHRIHVWYIYLHLP